MEQHTGSNQSLAINFLKIFLMRGKKKHLGITFSQYILILLPQVLESRELQLETAHPNLDIPQESGTIRKDIYRHVLKDYINKIHLLAYFTHQCHKASENSSSSGLMWSQTCSCFCAKCWWGLGPSELGSDHRVFINLQVFSIFRLPECPVMEEAVVIVLLIHPF